MTTENTNPVSIVTGSATYSPEDNKLRLYVGRVPRADYERLRAEGWTSTPKQNCDFVATWTPTRRDTALEFAEIIEDEDMGPEERAADRAQRFGEYRDKRLGEATEHADRFDAGPIAHGYQSQSRADRAAARHDRIAGRAVDAWGKAEYWQRRTAGVIAHALYKSTPGVRMGRIKIIEAELRKTEKTRAEYAEKWSAWQAVAAMTDPIAQTEAAESLAGVGYGYHKYKHPVTGREASLWDFLREDAADRITGAQAAQLYFDAHTDPDSPEWNETRLAQWCEHYKLRLAYENQMIEAAGGRASLVEMIPGGFIGSRQIRKVVKSPVTGLVVSVEVMGERSAFTRESDYKLYETRKVPVLLNIERLGAEAYRPPTPEELAAFNAARKAEKDAKPKIIKPPLVNPTDADAERLQALWNAQAKAQFDASGNKYISEFKPSTVCRITQAVYSANSKGSYARAETRGVCAHGELRDRDSNMYSRERTEREKRIGPIICEVRITAGDGSNYGAKRVIVLTDKSQKPLPTAVWEPIVVQPETVNA